MDPVEAKRNALLFDKICEKAFGVVLPVVDKAMRDGASLAAARSEIGQAHAALSRAQEDVRKEKWGEDLLRELGDILEHLDLAPRRNEVQKEADTITRTMMSSWIELLRETLSRWPEVNLSEDLLPQKDSVDSETWEAYFFNIRRLLIDSNRAHQIMQDLPSTFLSSSQEFEIPFGMVLRRGPQGMIAKSVRER
jgi:hypothetical protein